MSANNTGETALERIGYRLSAWVERWMPSPFLFALILSSDAVGVGLTGAGPVEMVGFWYDGFWAFLTLLDADRPLPDDGLRRRVPPACQRRHPAADRDSQHRKTGGCPRRPVDDAARRIRGDDHHLAARFLAGIQVRPRERRSKSAIRCCVAGYLGLGLTGTGGCPGPRRSCLRQRATSSSSTASSTSSSPPRDHLRPLRPHSDRTVESQRSSSSTSSRRLVTGAGHHALHPRRRSVRVRE